MQINLTKYFNITESNMDNKSYVDCIQINTFLLELIELYHKKLKKTIYVGNFRGN